MDGKWSLLAKAEGLKMEARRAETLASTPRLGLQQPAPGRGTHRNGIFASQCL